MAEATPQLAVKEVLARTMARPDEVAGALAPAAGGIRMLHHRPHLTAIDAAWAPGMRLMPHNHEMWAVIAVYQGAEDNEFFVRGAGDGLVERAGRRLETGDVVVLGEATIHAVANPGSVLTGAIHVYGGDFVNQPRSQWGPGDDVERPLPTRSPSSRPPTSPPASPFVDSRFGVVRRPIRAPNHAKTDLGAISTFAPSAMEAPRSWSSDHPAWSGGGNPPEGVTDGSGRTRTVGSITIAVVRLLAM